MAKKKQEAATPGKGEAAPDKRDKRARKKVAGETKDEVEARRLAACHATRRAKMVTWKERFIESLAREKSPSKAAEAAGISRTRAYSARDEDEDFAARWEECIDTVRDDLEAGAMKRAVEGWLEPVYYKGQAVGTVRKFSAAMTIFMLKCHRPDRYNLFFPEDDGGEGTPEQKAKKVRDALRGIRGSVPTAPPAADADRGDGDVGEG